MTEKHYVGEQNTEIVVDCGRDVSTASAHTLLFKRPDGTTFEKVATVYRENFLRCFTAITDFTISGEYEVQAKLTIGSWQGYGATAVFIIYESFS